MGYRFVNVPGQQPNPYLEGMLALVEAERARPDSLLAAQAPEFYARYHDSAGATIVALDGEALVGFGLLAFPEQLHTIWPPYAEQLGVDPGRCGYLVQSLIAPEHRGRGLAQALIDARLAAARERGLQHVFATVSPDNLPCLRAMERAHFRQLAVATVYSERVLRVLLHLELPASAESRPRVRLCELPTPLRPLPRLSEHLGVELWVKRDDLTGLATGGNKSRMLEYYVADARARGCRTLVTRGHLLSNHCRQTAAAAAKVGMNCVLVLKGERPDRCTGNHLLSTLLGAEIHWTRGRHDETFERVCAEVEARGGAPYQIAYAGADTLGIEAFVAAAGELSKQGQVFDRIVLASSSGATQAGLLVGTVVHRLPTQVTGISVDEPRALLESRIAQLARRVAADARVTLEVERRIEVDDRHLGAGYGVPGPREREAIELFARHEGLLLDPVYTGRAAAALIDRVRRGEIAGSERVLFWHTGGLPSLFAV